MTMIDSVSTTVERPGIAFEIDEAQLAAVSFLARYSGRTLDAYRHDLRNYFQWASDNDLAVLEGRVHTSSRLGFGPGRHMRRRRRGDLVRQRSRSAMHPCR
jgi:hypothetical protein